MSGWHSKPMSVALSWGALVLALGCGQDPLQKVQVTGTVTFDGGPCPAPGRVTFTPIAAPEGLPHRLAAGAFGVDGRFEASSFRPGDGVVPGTYLVDVACHDAAKLSGAPGDAELAAASYVSPAYEGETVEIKPGSGAVELNIDVPGRSS